MSPGDKIFEFCERHPSLAFFVGIPVALTAVILIILLVTMPFIVFSSWQESETYNRLTGAHTTTWDAMWVELRVQDKAKTDR